MRYLPLLLLHLLCIIIIFNNVDAQKRIKDRMYDPLKAIAACFRRMNGTDQIGCSSSRPSSTGVVHYITSKPDLQLIIQSGTAGSYIAVMPITLLEPLTPLLHISKQITGVVVHRVNDSLGVNGMSHEDKCPNRGYNARDTCDKDWNPYGTGLLRMDYRFPLVYLDEDDDIEKVKKCFVKFNNFSLETQRDRSLCALELNTFMYAAVDTPTCLRRSNSIVNLNPVKFCDPLGDQSIWGSIFPLANASQANISSDLQYIVLAARLDSTSMFNTIDSGAVNPITGLVTLLYTARLLKEMLPKYEHNYRKNILFLLFNGETYDYMGSQRILYDMERGNFPNEDDKLIPIRPDDISLFIELNQLNLKTENDKSVIHIHVPKESTDVREFISSFTLALPSSLTLREHDLSFPPSSLQTFLSSSTNSTISGLILTDHDVNSYTNLYYNNIYDDAERLDYHYLNLTEDKSDIFVVDKFSIQQKVADLSLGIAGAVYKEVTGVVWNEVVKENEGLMLVDELFHCYLETSNCKIHQAVQRKKLKDEPLSFYVGVTVAPNLLTNLIGLTLAWFTGDVLKSAPGPCPRNMTSDVYKFFSMSTNIRNLNETSCFRTSIGFTEAVSPAFLLEDYDWKSGKYSSWTESVWRDFSARLYLKPSPAHESMTMAIGSVTLVLSILLVYFINSRAHILFAPPIEV